MSLKRVQVTGFRCLAPAEVALDPRFTLISGDNASGKTSLLEAIYVLGRGRSFRTRRIEPLIRSGCKEFIVSGEVEVQAQSVRLGVAGSPTGVRARVRGETAQSLAELAAVLPVQIIDPEVHRLIEEGPSRRRRFLDWGVFHVEPPFMRHWQRYQQILKQRNAALRARQPSELVSVWNAELIRHGEEVAAARARYLTELQGQAATLAKALLGAELRLSYRSGWARDQSLAEALVGSATLDQEGGFTHVGPHRADLGLRLDGVAVKERVSRGQQKLLAATLLIAQLKLFPAEAAARPTLLLDDPAAELDSERLGGLIREVASQTAQLVVTTLHPDFAAFGRPGLRYRVAAGALRAAD